MIRFVVFLTAVEIALLGIGCTQPETADTTATGTGLTVQPDGEVPGPVYPASAASSVKTGEIRRAKDELESPETPLEPPGTQGTRRSSNR